MRGRTCSSLSAVGADVAAARSSTGGAARGMATGPLLSGMGAARAAAAGGALPEEPAAGGMATGGSCPLAWRESEAACTKLTNLVDFVSSLV